jgi:hypothetical protein
LNRFLAIYRRRLGDVNGTPRTRKERCSVEDEVRRLGIVNGHPRRDARSEDAPLDDSIFRVGKGKSRFGIFSILNSKLGFGEENLLSRIGEGKRVGDRIGLGTGREKTSE